MNILAPQRRFKRRDFLLSLMPIIAASRRRSSYLVSEDFEGTGTPSGWTGSGSPNFDYSAAPLVGAESLYCANSGVSALETFDAKSDVWVFCRMKRTAVPTSLNQACLEIRDAGGTSLASLRGRTTSNQWRLYIGSLSTTFSVSGSENSDLSVWLRYRSGPASAETQVYMAVGTEVLPALTSSYGGVSPTANAAQVRFLGNTGSPHIFDKVRVSASPIGSNPA